MSIVIENRAANVGSGGRIERAIFLLAGLLMAVLGAAAGWLCYRWAASDIFFEHRWAWITASGGLAFFMLRGAFFCLKPAKRETRIELGH